MFQDKTLTAYSLVALLRSGKGVGNATGHQQWHADLTKEQMEELGSRFLRLCIGTAAKASRVRVIDVDGD